MPMYICTKQVKFNSPVKTILKRVKKSDRRFSIVSVYNKAISKKKCHYTLFLKRLADELEAMKDNSMEGICEALTDELKELQQIYMKSQLHKQKQQQQQQVRHIHKGDTCELSD